MAQRRTNDQVLLDGLLQQRREQEAPSLSESDFFGLFVSEELLRSFDLSYDELSAGSVDGGDDGGIDSLYFLINGQLVLSRPDLDEVKLGRDLSFELFLIQTKRQYSFSELAVDRLSTTTKDLFNLSVDLPRIGYNALLLAIVDAFRTAYVRYASRFPELKIHYRYATCGATIAPKIQRRADLLLDTVRSLFPRAEVSFEFLGARELLDLARRRHDNTLTLTFKEGPLAASEYAYMGIVDLSQFFDFITDESRNLHRSIFDSNVRDYEGDVGVNLAIRDTLVSQRNEDFWWLNNGVTVVAERARPAGKSLTLKDPQIVNGLQTSRVIYGYLRDAEPRVAHRESRGVLVRVLVPPDSASRDRIIRATNSQTSIPGSALWATDRIQHDIEEYFAAHDLYYERRKNQYRDLSRSVEQVVSIVFVARAARALIHGEPEKLNRARFRSLRSETNYRSIFNPTTPLAAYLNSARLVRRVEIVGRNTGFEGRNTSRTLLFILAAYDLVLRMPGRSWLTPEGMADLDVDMFQDSAIVQSLDRVLSIEGKSRSGTVAGGLRVVNALRVAAGAPVARKDVATRSRRP